jgi:hypothetical protein
MGLTYSMRASKAMSAAASDTLSNEGIMQHIFEYAGAGRWLYLAKVSKKWRACYSRSHSTRHSIRDRAQYTAYRESFESQATLQQALDSGLQWGASRDLSFSEGLKRSWRLPHIAGQYASLNVLIAAISYGMPCASSSNYKTVPVLAGALESGSLEKVKWLLEHQQCPRTGDLMSAAAKSGVVDVVQYLQGLGIADGYGASSAVQYGHLPMLQLLYRRGCACEDHLGGFAAERGDLVMLQWLRANECPWGSSATSYSFAEVAIHAAKGHSMEVFLWLQQQGNVFTEPIMSRAASHGAEAIVKWLHAHGCPWSDEVLRSAAYCPNIGLLKWLHQADCPVDWQVAFVHYNDVYWCAAAGGSIECLEYCAAQHRAVWSAADLTVMLAAAGSHQRLETAKWLHQRGAEWPPVLCDYTTDDSGIPLKWGVELVQLARHQGCTSPEHVDEDDG